VWLVLALVALVSELHTNSFHAVYESAAALGVALVAVVWPSVLGQLAVFVLLSVLLLAFVRPRMVELLLRVRPRPTVAFPDIADRPATVRSRVTDRAGLVEVGRGEFWSARAYPPGTVFEPGEEVVVAYRVGVRLFVQEAPTTQGR
jgi:membrane protein implicated in regulation of membrane protease activity